MEHGPPARRASSTSRAAPWTGSDGTTSPRAARRSQGRSSRRAKVTGVARDGVADPRRGLSSASARPGREPTPHQLARVAQVLEPAVLVALDPGREDGLLPRAGGDLEPLELVDDRQHAGPPLALGTGGDVLPLQQEPHELLGGDGLDLAPQAVLGVGVDARQQSPRSTTARPRRRCRSAPAWRTPRPRVVPVPPGPGCGRARCAPRAPTPSPARSPRDGHAPLRRPPRRRRAPARAPARAGSHPGDGDRGRTRQRGTPPPPTGGARWHTTGRRRSSSPSVAGDRRARGASRIGQGGRTRPRSPPVGATRRRDSSRSWSSSGPRTSGAASARTRSRAAASRRPEGFGVQGRPRRSCTARVRRSSRGASSRNV